MKRLTKRSDKTSHENGVCCTHFMSKECHEVAGNCAYGCKWEESAWSKLADFEDAEEQGLLLRLPCKVGDTAYYVHREYLEDIDKWINTIDEVEVDSFVVNINIFVNVSLYVCGERFGKTLTPYKTLFFTKEAAEQALQKIQEEA